MKRVCAQCGQVIENELYYKVADNYLQVKYFENDELNCFCSQECFCDYVMLTATENRCRYDVTLSLNQLNKLKHWYESDGQTKVVYLDPIYLRVMATYFDMLGITSGNTRKLTEPDFVKKVFEEHTEIREKYPELLLCTGSDFSRFLNDAVDEICDAYGVYQSVYKETD